jgi:hypothetical protein
VETKATTNVVPFREDIQNTIAATADSLVPSMRLMSERPTRGRREPGTPRTRTRRDHRSHNGHWPESRRPLAGGEAGQRALLM